LFLIVEKENQSRCVAYVPCTIQFLYMYMQFKITSLDDCCLALRLGVTYSTCTTDVPVEEVQKKTVGRQQVSAFEKTDAFCFAKREDGCL
jgi:hypothetical protein